MHLECETDQKCLGKLTIACTLEFFSHISGFFTGHKKKKSKKYLDLAEKYRGLTDSGATDITCDKTNLTCGKNMETNNLEAVENGDTLPKCDSDTEMASNETKRVEERTQVDNASVGQETVNL